MYTCLHLYTPVYANMYLLVYTCMCRICELTCLEESEEGMVLEQRCLQEDAGVRDMQTGGEGGGMGAAEWTEIGGVDRGIQTDIGGGGERGMQTDIGGGDDRGIQTEGGGGDKGIQTVIGGGGGDRGIQTDIGGGERGIQTDIGGGGSGDRGIQTEGVVATGDGVGSGEEMSLGDRARLDCLSLLIPALTGHSALHATAYTGMPYVMHVHTFCKVLDACVSVHHFRLI